MDELDWERTAATDGGRFPLTDHTTGTEGGFFMQVLDSRQPSFIPTKMMCRFHAGPRPSLTLFHSNQDDDDDDDDDGFFM